MLGRVRVLYIIRTGGKIKSLEFIVGIVHVNKHVSAGDGFKSQRRVTITYTLYIIEISII